MKKSFEMVFRDIINSIKDGVHDRFNEEKDVSYDKGWDDCFQNYKEDLLDDVYYKIMRKIKYNKKRIM